MNNSENNKRKVDKTSVIYKVGTKEQIADYERYGINPITINSMDKKIKKAKLKKSVRYIDVAFDSFKKYPKSMALGVVGASLVGAMDAGVASHFMLDFITGPIGVSFASSALIANALDKFIKARWDNKHCSKEAHKEHENENTECHVPEYKRNHAVGAMIGLGALAIMNYASEMPIMENNLTPVTLLTAAVMYGGYNILTGFKKFFEKKAEHNLENKEIIGQTKKMYVEDILKGTDISSKFNINRESLNKMREESIVEENVEDVKNKEVEEQAVGASYRRFQPYS